MVRWLLCAGTVNSALFVEVRLLSLKYYDVSVFSFTARFMIPAETDD
jgi:hypothetical protein